MSVSTIKRFIWVLSLPVGLVNFFNPLGHSGQPRLHAVVGSIDIENGLPLWKTAFVFLDTKKEDLRRIKLKILRIVKTESSAILSFNKIMIYFSVKLTIFK